MNGRNVKIVKDTNGRVNVYSENGAFIESRPASGAIIRVSNGNVHVIQQNERWLTFEPENVISTQILPDPAVPFSSDATALAELLKNSFFFDTTTGVGNVSFPGYPSGSFQSFASNSIAPSAQLLTANALYGGVVWVRTETVITDFSINITVGAAGSSVAGLYKWNGTGWELVVQSPSGSPFNNATTGEQTRAITPTTIEAGIYATCILSNSAPTMFHQGLASYMNFYGNARPITAASYRNIAFLATTYTATLPATPALVGSALANVPLITMQIQ